MAHMQEEFTMDKIDGMGGFSSSGRWRRRALGKRSKKALTSLEADDQAELLLQVHQDSEALRRLGESLLKKNGYSKESRAEFHLEHETGMIYLRIFDAETGETQMLLTPEEVARSLQELEETDDNAVPLTSFFLDVTV